MNEKNYILENIKDYELSLFYCLLEPEIKPLFFSSLVIKPYCFSVPTHKKIFETMLKQARQGIKPDIKSLAADPDLAGIDKSYIANLTNDIGASLHNIQLYENYVITAWKIREAKKAVDRFNSEVDAPANAENIDPVLQEFQEKITSALKGSTDRGAFITFDDYINLQANNEYWKEYKPKLFGGSLPFPDGTISAVGARPGGGKSAALVNLCRELLTTEPVTGANLKENEIAQNINAERKILFISAEMSTKDLTDRLIHSLAWQTAGAGEPYFLDKVTETNKDYWKLLKKVYGNPPAHWTFTQDEIKRSELFKQLIEKHIEPAWNNRLKIAYVRGKKSFEDIYNIILNNAEQGTLVLLDYLQLMPICYSDIGQGNPRYLEIRHIMDMAIIAAEKTKSIIITAAQLGREEARGANKGDGTQGWRESGDIEQTAWNLIKMTREQENITFKIEKARSSAGVGADYKMQWIPTYQYMKFDGKANKPQSENTSKGKKTTANNEARL